jgi:DNA end-binding protein Ku
MRAVHTGSISWGLVNIPIKMYSATEDHDIKAHQVHETDGGKIRYKRVCECCDQTVETRDIAKAYDTDEGTKILTEDDLATIGETKNREIEVLEFVPATEIDPMMLDKPYFANHDGAAKAYTLLTKALNQSGRVAIVRLTMRSKTNLAVLRVVGKGDVLAIHTLRWADELREPDFPTTSVDISDTELTMASQLVESMNAETFNPDRYRDQYQSELRELLDSKTATDIGETVPGDVADLIAKLSASVAPKPKRGRKPVRVKVAT